MVCEAGGNCHDEAAVLGFGQRLKSERLEKKSMEYRKLSVAIFLLTAKYFITGWVSPMGARSEALTHENNGQIIICAHKEEKILPTPVIKQRLEAKISRLEADQGRKLRKTEKDALKDEVLHSLLPRAFSHFSQTMMWIDTLNGLIMVDCASAKKAEDTLALLRKSLGSLPVVPLTLENSIELTLTE